MAKKTTISDEDKKILEENAAKIANRPKLKVVNVPIGDLNPSEWNPRVLSSKDKNDLKRSLETYGCVEPVLVRKADMSIVGGHQRHNAAIELGWPDIPCVILDLSENDAKLLNIALNKISGDWETDKLEALLVGLASEDVDLGLTGFDDAAMSSLGIYLDPTLAPEPAVDTKPETTPTVHCPKCGFEFGINNL